jgi:hypothetical protein
MSSNDSLVSATGWDSGVLGFDMRSQRLVVK